jgi:cytidylate kinase
MSVITISRGSFSGGKCLAECLAKELGFRCVDRDVIVERAAACGVSQEELIAALEKPPTFLERFQHRKYLYLALIQAAITEEVRTGKVVYHGNAGHLLLRDGPHVLRVRIIAPLEFRLKMARDRLRLTAEEALAHIQRMDQQRRKWTHYLYGVDSGDPSLYDVVLNLEHMAISDACGIVAAMARQSCFEFTPELQESMDDLALASRVRADLAVNSSTSHLEVRVVSRRGALQITGKLSSTSEMKEVRRVAAAVAGVTSVDLDQIEPPHGH